MDAYVTAALGERARIRSWGAGCARTAGCCGAVNDIGMPSAAVYVASKRAVQAAMTAVATELAPRSVRANAISELVVDGGMS